MSALKISLSCRKVGRRSGRMCVCGQGGAGGYRRALGWLKYLSLVNIDGALKGVILLSGVTNVFVSHVCIFPPKPLRYPF